MFEQTFAIASDLALVAGLGAQVRETLSAHRVDNQLLLAVEICVVEAVNNSIEHAYEGDAGEVIEVRLALARGELVVEVRDRGRGLAPENLARAQWSAAAPQDLDSLPERGRGLAVIRRVMNDVSYRQRGGVNTLRMRRSLDERFIIEG